MRWLYLCHTSRLPLVLKALRQGVVDESSPEAEIFETACMGI